MKLARLAPLYAVVFVFLLVALGRWGAAPAPAARESAPPVPARVVAAARHDLSPPLRTLPPLALQPGQAPEHPRRLPGSAGGDADPVVQRLFGPGLIPAPRVSFEGVNNINSVHPPDTQGDVGRNHYVQWVNISFQIFDKQGASVYGPAAGNTLWQGFGGPCETRNDGDPITLYDSIADRWLMTQFALPGGQNGYWQCLAVSQTADPTGAWYRYAFQTSTTKLNDYPKFGVWPDGYYMTANLFQGFSWAGVGAYVFDRARMLNGQSATMQFFELPPSDWGGMLPSDFDGITLPPAGAPNVFLEVVDGAWDPANWPNDELHLHRFHVDWVNPANTTFNITPIPLAVAPFDGLLCNFSQNCIRQPGTAIGLDAIADRLMYRLAYRNFGTHESLVVNHTVDTGGDVAGVRWYELRSPNGTPVIYQQGTYAPADGLSRWMGSISMDAQANMLLGFSTSNGNWPNYPSIRYTGRLASDPPGQMTQGEGVLWAGTGSQTSTFYRWGDYSMMSIDPIDDCTFWYTNEYLQTTGFAPWRTRIGSVQFPGCASPQLTPTPTPTGTPPTVTAMPSFTPSPTATPTASNTPTGTPTMTGTPPTPTFTPSPTATTCGNPAGWIEAAPFPSPVLRAAGVWYPPNERFYVLGGRKSDGSGDEIINPHEYDPTTNTWVTKTAEFEDNRVHTLVAGVLDGPSGLRIYTVGGGAAGEPGMSDAVRIYDPIADTLSVLTSDPWPGSGGTVLPGAAAVYNNKLYVFGGFDTAASQMVDVIWEFDPNGTAGARWTQKSAVLPVPLGYIPLATIGDYIYLAGGLAWGGTGFVDTNGTSRYDPVADSLTPLANIPRATGGTRAVRQLDGTLWVLGGGRQSPNPSNQVNVYDPATDTWTLGPSYITRRRDSAADIDPATGRIYMVGGYVSISQLLSSLEVYRPAAACLTPTPTATPISQPRLYLPLALLNAPP